MPIFKAGLNPFLAMFKLMATTTYAIQQGAYLAA